MSDKVDFTVFILRFIIGAILGTIAILALLIPFLWAGVITGKMILVIGSAVAISIGVFATILGDRFLVGLTRILRFFTFFT